ncbi:hypothetical protein B566_EDAN008924 [Ephemera danica]|nr:hypothetical protein B566_EDAN008924 [Ephemera danica]
MPAGEHSFPFQYRLPSHLPSSYEGKYGRVRYTVSISIGRPWKLDHVTRAIFTAPLTSSKQKQFSSFCCGRGVVNMMLALPTGGFVPGELVKYHAVRKSRARMSTVTQKVLGPMEPGKSQQWRNEALAIPALPPSNLTNCRIIDIEDICPAAPPNYEECNIGAATNLAAEEEDNEFTGFDAHYTPRYPVYRT